jgi:hypothetical protein
LNAPKSTYNKIAFQIIVILLDARNICGIIVAVAAMKREIRKYSTVSSVDLCIVIM